MNKEKEKFAIDSLWLHFNNFFEDKNLFNYRGTLKNKPQGNNIKKSLTLCNRLKIIN
mgnify:CR=1 FL=1